MKTIRTGANRTVAEKITTKIWCDIPYDEADKFSTKQSLCRGYDFFNDLLGKLSWHELIFLLMRGDIPKASEAALLNLVMSSLINPGPRDWATQAAMTSAVTGTTVGNSLLTGLAVLQGRYHGALCVEQSIEMFHSGVAELQLSTTAKTIRHTIKLYPDTPGYGLHYAKPDMRAASLIAETLKRRDPGPHLSFALMLEKQLEKKKGICLTLAGAASAILADLGFTPREGHGIFLISATPGILAHLLEQMSGSWTTYPFHEAPVPYKGMRKKLSAQQKAYREKA